MYSFNNLNIFKVLIGCSLFLTVLANRNYYLALSKFDVNTHILNLLSTSPEAFASNPDCVKNYNAESMKNSQDFQLKYDNCLSETEQKTAAANAETLKSRELLASNAEKSCKAIMQCQNQSKVDGEYKCYVSEGDNNYKVSQNISNEASMDLANYEAEIYFIQFSEESCVNKTILLYGEKFNDLKKKFDICLKTNEWPAEPSTTTTTTTTTTSIPTTTTTTTTKMTSTTAKVSTTTTYPTKSTTKQAHSTTPIKEDEDNN